MEDLEQVASALRRIADMPRNDQPRYPNGLRPFGTREMDYVARTVENAVSTLATAEAEAAELRAEVERLRAYVQDVANQWLPNEPEPADDFDPQFEDAYVIIVERARTALAGPSQ